jgi:multidrug efflux system membrane fusion protein
MRMSPTMLAALAALPAACLMAPGCSTANVQSAGKKSEIAASVTVATVTRKNVPVEVRAIGNVEAYTTISVKAQIGGELTRVHFHEGDSVKKGDLLFQIDPRPYEEAIRQAEANLAKDAALLNQAEANRAHDAAQEKYVREQAGRYAKLFEHGVLSRDQADQVRSDADARAEAVRADQAAIESARAAANADKAALDTLKLQLSYCSIRSPIDGKTGNLAIKQGNIVKANDVDLVTINQVQPIYVTFSVPEDRLPEIKQHMAKGKLAVLANRPSDNTTLGQGAITFIDNAIDATTGTIKLKGTFPNENENLWPGQFVSVVLRLATKPDAIVVPSQVVQTGQTGNYVFVVKPDETVEMRTVTKGTKIGSEIEIENGLQPGETVVSNGQLRLAPGMRVQVKK